MSKRQTLKVIRAEALPAEERAGAWLVESLWGRRAVGMLAGHPKSGKSWLGLDAALSVASGTPCLGRFEVPSPGPALVYLAEDALPEIRKRLQGIAAHRGLSLAKLPLWVIAAPRVRLDCDADRQCLEATVAKLRPSLLLLDPLVRLHQCDENDAMAIAGLLSYLRTLQRRHAVAVMLVHHARKNGGTAGLALRGSSDLWAWGDSNLYLGKARGKLLLRVEQRCAKPIEPIALTLEDTDPERVHLEAGGEAAHTPAPTEAALRRRVCEALASGPMTRTRMRAVLGIRNERLGTLLTAAVGDGVIEHTRQGWRLVQADSDERAAGRRTPGEQQACSLFPL